MPKRSFSALEPITDLKPSKQSSGIAATRMPGEYSSDVPAVNMPQSPDIQRAASQHFLSMAANPDFDSSLNTEGFDDTERPQEPITVENLPAVLETAIAVDVKFNPTWYQVAKLPGNIRNGIRQLGKSLFSQFTTVPTDKIWEISTLTNPIMDVKAVFAWIRQHAHKVDDIDIDFHSIPGYKADVELWMFSGVEFLLVKDFAGYYIYSWPAANSIAGSGPDLQQHIERAKTSGKPLREALEEQFIQQYAHRMEEDIEDIPVFEPALELIQRLRGTDFSEYRSTLESSFPGIISNFFDWKETDEMEEWIAQQEQAGYTVYEDPIGDGDDTYCLLALPPEQEENPFDVSALEERSRQKGKNE